MTQLSVGTVSTPDGYDFTRSDGQRFFLTYKDTGSAVLYLGPDRTTPPVLGLVEFDVSVADKLKRACEYVLAYPDQPASP